MQLGQVSRLGMYLAIIIAISAFSFAQESNLDLNISLDENPPVVSGITTTPSTNSAIVRWNTDKPADSQVEYGLSTGYGSSTNVDSVFNISHNMNVVNLTPVTLYHFRIISADAAGLFSPTNDNTFSTITTGPVLNFISPTPGSVVIGQTINVSYSVSTPGQGNQPDHAHFTLDQNPEVMDLDFDGFYQFTGVPFGSHVLAGYLAMADHSMMQGSGASVAFSNSPSPSPAVTFTINPTGINLGGSATLSWTVTNASTIIINQGIGSVAPSGNRVVSPNVTTTYTITATNAAGTTVRSVTLTVFLPSTPPSATFSASPTTINLGQTSTLTFNVINASSISINQGVGPVNSSGTKLVSPTVTTTYTLTAANNIGTTTRTVTITVNQPAPTASISVSPTSITQGQSATLSWSTSNSDTISINNGIGTVAPAGSISVSPTTTTTYVITASGPGGTITNSVTLTVLPLPPTVTFSVSPSTILVGQATTLTWSTTGATSISIDNGIGSVANSGSRSVSPASTTTYTITASNAGGTTIRTVTVTVNSPPPAAIFSASLTTITQGQSTTLTWTTANATLISIDNGIGSVAASGSISVSPSTTTAYALTASGPGGTITRTVTITVNPSPPTISLSVTPSSITQGQSSTLSWTVTGATSVSINNGIGSVAASGSISVSPSTTTTYTLTASNSGGTTTRSTTITVIAPLPDATFTSSLSTITIGQQVTLSWTTTDATSVSINNGIGSVAVTGSVTVSPVTDTTYILTVNGPGGSITRSLTISVITSLPNITQFTASPTSISVGGSSTLTWLVDGVATLVNIDNGIGPVLPYGSITVTPAGSTTYTITALSDSGSVTRTATVTVDSAVPEITFFASPSLITQGGSSILSWSVTGATNVYIEGIGDVSAVGYFNLTLAENTTYTIIASSPGGIINRSVTITVLPPVLLPGDIIPPTISIMPRDGSIVFGDIEIAVAASDNAGVTFVELYKNGVFFADDISAPYAFKWNTSLESDGAYTIMARATDTSGNKANVTITLTVDNLPAIPSEVIISRLTSTSATVEWTTGKPAIGYLEYGTSLSLGITTSFSDEFFANQAVNLDDLNPDTDYYYRIITRTIDGLVFTSDVKSFRTLASNGVSTGNGTNGVSDSIEVMTRVKPAQITKVSFGNFPVRLIALMTLDNIESDVTFTLSRIAKPNLPEPPGVIYEYIRIDMANTSKMTNIEVDFEVPKTWIEANKVSPEIIRFLRYDNRWESMGVRRLSESAESYLYRSSVPGFSVFAIVAYNGTIIREAPPPATSIFDPLVSFSSQFPVPTQYFIISGAMFIAAVLLWMLRHHGHRYTQPKPDNDDVRINEIRRMIYNPSEEEAVPEVDRKKKRQDSSTSENQ